MAEITFDPVPLSGSELNPEAMFDPVPLTESKLEPEKALGPMPLQLELVTFLSNRPSSI